MFLLPLGALAQTPPVNVYLCGTGQATFTPTFPGYTLSTNDQIIWKVDGVEQTPIAYSGSNGSITTSASLTAQAAPHTYSVKVFPADQNLCPSDYSDDILVQKLPDPAIALVSTGTNYCVDNSGNIVITASPNGITLPSGVSMAYVWSATLAGTPVANMASLGTASGDKFTVASTGVAVGAYVFKAVGSYAIAGGIPIVPTASCSAEATTAITITAKPGKATITIAP